LLIYFFTGQLVLNLRIACFGKRNGVKSKSHSVLDMPNSTSWNSNELLNEVLKNTLLRFLLFLSFEKEIED
jgi:hypothetical protein